MTNHVFHTNKMMFNLKKKHHDQVFELQTKIMEQENLIKDLNQQVKMLSEYKLYDC